MSRADGRRADQLRPLDARPGLPRAAARLGALVAGEDARALHGVDRGGRAALAPPLRPRLDDRRVLAAARVDRRAHRARGGARQAGRADGRDPAADRPRAAGGRRLRGARRADGLARLRRAPGRRRHALRGDLRRVRRGAPRARPLRALEGAHRLGRGRLGRRRRRRAAARPRLLGGLDRRGRHERRHDRRRPPRRGAGDGRARSRSTASGSTRCSTSPRPGSRRSRPRRTTADRASRACPELSTAGRRCCGCSSPPGSAARSGSSASCATARPGFRTHLLVSLGSALFTIVSAYGFDGLDVLDARAAIVFDPTRIAAQIVTGIGFLGAGAIIRRGPLRARPDDRGDALGRRRDRDGRRRRLLRPSASARRLLVLFALGPLQLIVARGSIEPRPAGGGRARDRARARGRRRRACSPRRGARRRCQLTSSSTTSARLDVTLRASRRSRVARGVAEERLRARRRERVQWRP